MCNLGHCGRLVLLELTDVIGDDLKVNMCNVFNLSIQKSFTFYSIYKKDKYVASYVISSARDKFEKGLQVNLLTFTSNNVFINTIKIQNIQGKTKMFFFFNNLR